MKCFKCKGSGKSDQHDRCIPISFYNCECCDGTGKINLLDRIKETIEYIMHPKKEI